MISKPCPKCGKLAHGLNDVCDGERPPETGSGTLEQQRAWALLEATIRHEGVVAGSPPITASDFEAGCNNAISGWLWDESYSLQYSEPVSLGISEMRYIANLIRVDQGLQPGVVQEFSEGAANTQ